MKIQGINLNISFVTKEYRRIYKADQKYENHV